MKSRRDIRPAIMEGALTNPDLTAVQRAFLFTVVHLATEYVDGKRRPGSRGMGPDGKFALHLDYLGNALHTSPENAKKITQRLAAIDVLSKVHPGTFGRPAMWQALDVRGDMKYRVTFRTWCPPLRPDVPPTRGDTASPLTYRTPTDPSHAPADGVSSAAEGREKSGSDEKAEPTRAASRPVVCEFHPWQTCPDDCRNSSRESA